MQYDWICYGQSHNRPLAVDDRTHRYELSVRDMMVELEAMLSPRGYSMRRCRSDDVWVFETHWGRGAACGEIGSVLYGLVSENLREVDPES